MFSLNLRFHFIMFHLDYEVHYNAYEDVTTLKKTRWRLDRIRQLIGLDTVYLSVVCKLIFAFPPEISVEV